MSFFKFIKPIFLENWLAKLICLLIAIGLWSWVAIQQTSEKQYEVPVNFTEVPEGKIVSPEVQNQVTVRIRGPKTTLGNLTNQDLGLSLSLGGLEGNEGVVRIFPWDVDHPSGVEVVEIDPGNIRLSLEAWEKKSVSVQPQLSGEKSASYTYSYEVDPDTAVIVAPRSDIQDIEELPLETVKWPEPASLPERKTVRAELSSNYQLEYPPENRFVLFLEARRSISTREFGSVPIEVKSIPEGKKAIPSPENITVKVKGPAQLVESMAADDIDLSVESPAVDEGISIKKIQFSLPDGVELGEDYSGVRTIKVRLEDK